MTNRQDYLYKKVMAQTELHKPSHLHYSVKLLDGSKLLSGKYNLEVLFTTPVSLIRRMITKIYCDVHAME
jgi:hypothetical protein